MNQPSVRSKFTSPQEGTTSTPYVTRESILRLVRGRKAMKKGEERREDNERGKRMERWGSQIRRERMVQIKK